MYPFGHVGIGEKLVHRWTQGLPLPFVLLGTLFPDLIDKPLHYGLTFILQNHENLPNLFNNTRAIGHTLLFLSTLSLVAWIKKSPKLQALCWGIGSHLVLDGIQEFFMVPAGEREFQITLLWPLIGMKFPKTLEPTLIEHVSHAIFRPFIWLSEIVGFVLVVRMVNALRKSKKLGLANKGL